MAINVGYFFKESLTNFRRNWVMSLGAVITIYLSLLLVGVSMVAGYVVSEVLGTVEEKVSIQIFLKDGAPTEEVEELQAWLLRDELVESVNYVSKEQALERFRESAGSPEIVDSLRENPLPASLDVALRDPRTVEEMATKILANETFLSICDKPDDPTESIKYGEEIVDQLFGFTRVVRIVGAVFMGMLAVVSLIFINNTIRLAIHARRKEIGIMRLVGASNWFIRAPFLLEGVIQSMIGVGLAILTVVALQLAVLPRLAAAVPLLSVEIPPATIIQVALVLIVAGVAIGLLGSGMALRRYLKV